MMGLELPNGASVGSLMQQWVRQLTPQQLNPMDHNPLRDILVDQIEHDIVAGSAPWQAIVDATVRRARVCRVFPRCAAAARECRRHLDGDPHGGVRYSRFDPRTQEVDGAMMATSVVRRIVTGIAGATFTVTRTGGTAAFAVNFATSNSTATVADNDYVANSGTLTFGTNTVFADGGTMAWTLQNPATLEGASQLIIEGNLDVSASAGGLPSGSPLVAEVTPTRASAVPPGKASAAVATRRDTLAAEQSRKAELSLARDEAASSLAAAKAELAGIRAGNRAACAGFKAVERALAEARPDRKGKLFWKGAVLTAEILQDVRLLPPDLPPAAIISELGRLKQAPLLHGSRGSPALDVAALAHEIVGRVLDHLDLFEDHLLLAFDLVFREQGVADEIRQDIDRERQVLDGVVSGLPNKSTDPQLKVSKRSGAPIPSWNVPNFMFTSGRSTAYSVVSMTLTPGFSISIWTSPAVRGSSVSGMNILESMMVAGAVMMTAVRRWEISTPAILMPWVAKSSLWSRVVMILWLQLSVTYLT